jgi:hypothetical protein
MTPLSAADLTRDEARKVVTSYVCPPIPTRSHDWCAHFDGEEEAGGYGYGATEAEAIADFLDNQHWRECQPRNLARVIPIMGAVAEHHQALEEVE